MEKVKYRIKNFLREAEASKWLSYLMLYKIFFIRSKARKLQLVSAALSHTRSHILIRLLMRLAKRMAVPPPIHPRSQASKLSLGYSLIIKPYVSPEEKGVLLISFESELEKLIESGLVERVQRHFRLIFLPSWTGLFSKPLIQLTQVTTDSVFVMPVHDDERKLVQFLGDQFHSLPFNASSWVNNKLYRHSVVSRKIDCLMIANFSEFKRHWLLFDLLNKAGASYSVACVGVPLGSRSAQSIAHEASLFGAQNVTIVENPSQEDLRSYFSSAKTFCAMSFREGSFIAVAEALLSGTPVIGFKNAQFGTKNLISENNGCLVRSASDFIPALSQLIKHSDHSQIRERAHETLGAEVNVPKLNEEMRRFSLSRSERWTRDIVPFYSQRLKFYYLAEDLSTAACRADLSILENYNVFLD